MDSKTSSSTDEVVEMADVPEISARRRQSLVNAPKARMNVNITFQEVTYSIGKKKSKKKILHGLTGTFQPGKLTCILGSTGAGKSTFIDILAGRNKAGKVGGQVRMNGVDARKIFSHIGGYVLQADLLMVPTTHCLHFSLLEATQTVRETLTFYADLHLKLSRAQKRAKVDALMQQLGIFNVQDTYVGNEMIRGVSGGEMKRVAIGAALVTDPSVLLLDEPTSGLDSYNALGICNILKGLALTGHTVICTIHQPSSEIFGLFDNVMLLHHGRIVYYGTTGNALHYFQKVGYFCPQYFNPADFYIDLLNDEGRKIKLGETDLFYKTFLATVYEEMQASCNTAPITRHVDEINVKEIKEQKKRVNGLYQFWYLGGRNLKNLVRDPRTSFAQLGQALFLALLIGSLYFQMAPEASSINDRFGVIFFICKYLLLSPIFNSVGTNQAFGGFTYLTKFLEQRDLFQRERAAGDYTVLPYVLSRFLTELPGLILFPFILCAIAYWMTGLSKDGSRFMIFCVAMILQSMTATSLFVTVGAISPNPQLALIFSPVLVVLMMLFGGFFISLANIPVYYSWFGYLSFFKWTIALTMTNELGGQVYNCTRNDSICGGNSYYTGEEALLSYGFDGVEIWQNFLVLIAMILFYRTCCVAAIYYMHVEKK